MTVLAVVSPKGGVGKTTVALNLAYVLAKRGWPCLLVDADPQGAIGLSLTGKAREAKGLAECLSEKLPLREAVLSTRVPNFHILPIGHPPLRQLARWDMALADGRYLASVLRQAEADYRVVLVDTGSGLTGTTHGVLCNATHLLSPLQAQPLALRVLPQLLETVGAFKSRGMNLTIAGLVLTMVQTANPVSLSVSQESWGLFSDNLLLESFVPADPVFLEASAKGVPVGLLSRHPPRAAMVFENLAVELEPRLGLISEDREDEPIPLLD
jgi:chromosome partitioning protein